MVSPVINPPILETYRSPEFANLMPQDLIRDGLIIQIDHIWQWAAQLISDFLAGGSTHLNLNEFSRFYEEVRPQLQLLNTQLDLLEEPLTSDLANEVISFLKIHAKLNVMSWSQSLKELEPFQEWEQKIQNITSKAKERDLSQLTHLQVRWLKSSQFGRNLAAISRNMTLPYRYKNIPKGSLLLTNHDMYQRGQTVGENSLFKKVQKYILNLIVQLFTGPNSYTHAEIILNNQGEMFHAKKTAWLRGESSIESKRNRVSYAHKIYTPNELAFIEAYQQKHGVRKTFSEIWSEIRDECHAQAGQLHTDLLLAMKKTIYPAPRPGNYDCRTALDNSDTETYACSAMIAGVFGRVGIDIAEQFNKTADSISPRDLSESNLYTAMEGCQVYL